MKKKFDFRIVLFVIGGSLLAINIFGLFVPLRSDLILEETLYRGKTSDTVKLSDKEAIETLQSIPARPEEDFLRTATETINKAVLHYWDDELADEFGLRVPMRENWILWVGSHVLPQYFSKYEFCHYWEKGVERGVGWCSQSSAILARYLETRGVRAEIYVMYRHVIVTTEINRKSYIADPDYGVVLPFDMSQVEANPEIVRSYYEAAGYSAADIETVIRAFDPSVEQEENPAFSRHTDYCSKRHQTFELSVYTTKWAVPIMIVLSFVYLRLKQRARQQ